MSFLQARFVAEYQPEARRQWKQRAAGLYQEYREPEPALKLYLSAEAWEEASGILRTLGLHLLQSGRMGDLARWIGALPENHIQNDPWLTIYLCTTRRFTAARKNLSDLTRATVQFREQGDARGRLMALAYLVEAQYIIGIYVPETIRESLDLVDSLKTDDFPFERAHLWYQIGFCETLHGDYGLAYNACRNATLIARQLKNDTLLVNALANSITIVAFLGKFQELGEIRREMEVLLAGTDSQEVHAFYEVADSIAMVFSGHPDQGVSIIQTCLSRIESHGLYYMNAPALLYHLICLGYNGQVEEARAAAVEAIQFVKITGNLFTTAVNHLFWGITLYRSGQFDEAVPSLEEAVAAMRSGSIQAPHHEAAGTLVLNLVRMGRGEPPDIPEMERAHERYQNSGSPLLAADSTLSMALAYRAADLHEEADSHLIKGFSLTAQYGYDFFIFLSINDLARAGTEALAGGLKQVLPEVTRLLTGRCADVAPRYLRPLLKHARTSVRDMARDLLLKIRRQSLPLVRIKTLGDFTVYRGDAPVSEDEWAGSMPKDLLKAIISLGPSAGDPGSGDACPLAGSQPQGRRRQFQNRVASVTPCVGTGPGQHPGIQLCPPKRECTFPNRMGGGD